MNPPAIEDELPERFKLYLKIKAMRDDDRSMPYIAKKLGFNNASSVQTLINTYGWVSAHTAQEAKRARIDELKRAKMQGYIAGPLTHRVDRRIAALTDTKDT